MLAFHVVLDHVFFLNVRIGVSGGREGELTFLELPKIQDRGLSFACVENEDSTIMAPLVLLFAQAHKRWAPEFRVERRAHVVLFIKF